jgi:hypothetical protein
MKAPNPPHNAPSMESRRSSASGLPPSPPRGRDDWDIDPSMPLALSLLATLAHASEPTVNQRARTALDERRTDTERARAIVALADLGSSEANEAIDALVVRLGEDSPLGRVAVAARVQSAELFTLATRTWPEWAMSLVEARLDGELAAHCMDPDVWTLPVPTETVVAACGHRADVPALARAVAGEQDPAHRQRAAHLLSDLGQLRPDEVGAALLAAFRWERNSALPIAEGPAVLGTLIIPEALRRSLAEELVCWRVSAVLVGRQQIPERLDAELTMLLSPEIHAYGEATQTIDWVYLLAASGQDPSRVLSRLGVQNDRAYASVLDDLRLLRASPRALLPMLAHRSPIQRARAAEALEQQPTRTIAALDRAAHWRPGRTFPLRGDIAPPRLVRSPAAAEVWTYALMDWAELATSRLDAGELRAVLWLLAEPTNTTLLAERVRQDVAHTLLEAAQREVDPRRASLLGQAMDAVLRRVPLNLGLAPAPEQVREW